MSGETLFFRLLNMSLTGGAVIALLIILRPFLRKLPKKYLCLFWLIPLFRLLVPVSIPSPLSLLPVNSEPIVKTTVDGVGVAALDTGIRSIDIPVNLVLIEQQVPKTLTSVNPLQVWVWVFLRLWALGALLFLAVSFFRYLKMKKAAAEAVPGEPGVYYSDRISMPMVLGVMKPRIYLPLMFQKEENAGEKVFVLEHENAHKKRLDHLTKFLAFLALAAHWFNPLVWAAYFLLCKDMEMACDEKVMETLGEEKKKDYSLALLHFEERRSSLLLPLAFGESHTKSRIKNILSYKTPRSWIRLAGVVLLGTAAWTLLSAPQQTGTEGDPATVVIGGADGPTSIFLAGKVTEDSKGTSGDSEGTPAEPVDLETVKTQPYGTDVELDYVSAEKISMHGDFGYFVFTLEPADNGGLFAGLYRAVSLSEAGGIQMQGDDYTEIIGGDGAALILPGIYNQEMENPSVYLYYEESNTIDDLKGYGEDAADLFVAGLRGEAESRLTDAAVEAGLLGPLTEAVRRDCGDGTTILYGPVEIRGSDSAACGFLAADSGNVEDLWYGIWWEESGRTEKILLFE